ncbi:MAG TPA: SIMPL domain-containing protein [Pirellulaceae bacterium]|nr:SIMPL domain-containing protein [Pirellulaceae bacterium]
MTRFIWLLLLGGIFIAGGARAEEPRRTIEVSATEEVEVDSDYVALTLGIATNGEEIEAVKKRLDALTRDVYDLAAAQRLSPPTLSSTSVRCEFRDEETHAPSGKGQQQYPSSKGQGKGGDPFSEPDERHPPISMSRGVAIRFSTLPQALQLLKKLTTWDSVRKSREITLEPLVFGVTEPLPIAQKVRQQAVKLAKVKAKALADASGLKLGQALSIKETSSSNSLGPSWSDDPFSAVTPPRDLTGAEAIQHVAVQREAPKASGGKIDLDELAPQKIQISVRVEVVYEAKE